MQCDLNGPQTVVLACETSVPGPTWTSRHVRFSAARGGEADISRRILAVAIYEYAPQSTVGSGRAGWRGTGGGVMRATSLSALASAPAETRSWRTSASSARQQDHVRQWAADELGAHRASVAGGCIQRLRLLRRSFSVQQLHRRHRHDGRDRVLVEKLRMAVAAQHH